MGSRLSLPETAFPTGAEHRVSARCSGCSKYGHVDRCKEYDAGRCRWQNCQKCHCKFDEDGHCHDRCSASCAEHGRQSPCRHYPSGHCSFASRKGNRQCRFCHCSRIPWVAMSDDPDDSDLVPGRLPKQKGISKLFAWIDAGKSVLLHKAQLVGDTVKCDSERSHEFLGRIRVGRRIHADAFRVLFDALMEELHDSHIQRLRCWGDEVHETSADQSVQTQIQKCVQLSRPFFERADQLQIWEELSSLSQEDLAARQLPEGDVNAQLQDFARMLKARFRAQRDDEHAFPNLYLKGKFLRFLPLSFAAIVDRVSWRIAFINFHDYWARGMKATDFPIRGFAKKYHAHLLLLADEHFRTQSSL